MSSLAPAAFAVLTAAATELTPAPDAASPVRVDADAWSDVPIYIQTRGSLAVPSAAHGDVAVAGVALGILVDEDGRNALGLRFSYMDDPPESPFARDTPPLPSAWGPVVDWTFVSQPQRRASFYFSGSVGYVYGTPADDTYDNVILPIVEGGVGLRFSRRAADGTIWFVSPELGLVPGALAPLTALNLGVILPGGNR